MQNAIKITVVIPAYNIAGYIERAIESVLNQTRPADEIIVVDDGSTDNTAETIKKFDTKVTYIHQQNKGLSGARNTGIKTASNDWIAFLDGDDEWLPICLEKHAALITANPSLAWATGNFLRCLCDEDRIAPSIDPARTTKLLAGLDYFDNYFHAFANRAAGHPNTMIIHRKVFDTVGFFNEQQTFAEDLEMWWRIALDFPQVGYSSEPLAIYHLVRPGTLTEEFRTTKFDILVDLLEKNIAIAKQKKATEQFAPLPSFLVRSWIRGMLFENRPDDIKKLLDRFGSFLPLYFKTMVTILMICPGATAATCHMISRVVRKLNLRKGAIRKPEKPITNQTKA